MRHPAGSNPAQGEMTGQRAEQGRLSAAGRPQDADELLWRDLKGDVLQHLKAGASLSEMECGARNRDAAAHRLAPAVVQGVARAPTALRRTLLPVPSRPISSMPTTIPSYLCNV